MTTPSSRHISRPMLEKALELMQGYKEDKFEMWVSHTGIMYLTVFNIVYNIDLDGNSVARRKDNGEAIPFA